VILLPHRAAGIAVPAMRLDTGASMNGALSWRGVIVHSAGRV